jgi:hypothetical protein
MREAIPQFVLTLGYIATIIAAASFDLRAGLLTFGLLTILEAREASR